MSGKVSDLPIRFKRAVFTQEKIDRINFRSGNGGRALCGRVLRNPPGVTTRCWSRAWSHDSLSHGILPARKFAQYYRRQDMTYGYVPGNIGPGNIAILIAP